MAKARWTISRKSLLRTTSSNECFSTACQASKPSISPAAKLANTDTLLIVDREHAFVHAAEHCRLSVGAFAQRTLAAAESIDHALEGMRERTYLVA